MRSAHRKTSTFHRLIFRPELQRKRLCSLLLVGVVNALGQFAWGGMYLQGAAGDHAMSAAHDRYYSGPDKAFIGASLDFSGVSSNPPWATMISPQYFITAYHLPANSQSTLTFHEGNDASSGAHTYDVDTGFGFVTTNNNQPSDVYLGRLTAPIPATDHIVFYPVLSLPNSSNYVGMTIYNYGNPNRLGRNVISRIEPYAEGSENQVGMFFDYDAPGLGEDETYLISGDSGGPSFAVVNGTLALLGEHFSTYGTSGMIPFDGGPPPGWRRFLVVGRWFYPRLRQPAQLGTASRSANHTGLRSRRNGADHHKPGRQHHDFLAARLGRVCVAAEQ